MTGGRVERASGRVERPRALRRWPLLLCLGALLAGCGATATAIKPPANGVSGSGFQGLVIRPPESEPRLALRNYTGRAVNLRTFRGKVALVTFVYTHCPNVCPLIVSNLAAADRQLGPAARNVQIVAVTVDPKNDTPAAVKKFLAARDATGTMDYLIGNRRQLLPVWKAWGIAVTVNKYEDAESHSALIFGITPQGKIAVVYPSNFTPAQIVHDVPLLERS